MNGNFVIKSAEKSTYLSSIKILIASQLYNSIALKSTASLEKLLLLLIPARMTVFSISQLTRSGETATWKIAQVGIDIVLVWHMFKQGFLSSFEGSCFSKLKLNLSFLSIVQSINF
jgi:hypothetical protein